ncbi:hypothetical protein CMO83_04315 [Candidatus Woesearchaeota archaeon]|jgi:hypothetical protein|nr:hypothetical protein [Candidatus Woesearchaeota archaeon]|tara:strand:+ start:1648 stop:2004 length:357 start_codon:yes stop_codon:yes gene_type:complete
MAKSYSELEAWGIFVGALIIGIVLTSVFWGFITIPEDAKNLEKEIGNASETVDIEIPIAFIEFCDQVKGDPNWDNSGFRQCIVKEPTEKNLIVMNLLCKKFDLNLSYGSFGVKCEGTK